MMQEHIWAKLQPNTHLPPFFLPHGQLDTVAVQRQVEGCYGDVLGCMADTHDAMVTVPQQSPGSFCHGGSRPSVAVHQRPDRRQVVKQILEGETQAGRLAYASGGLLGEAHALTL